MSVEIQFVAKCRDLPESLWERCFPYPLESLFWYETLETCGIDDQFQFSYALIKKDGQSVGIAPCFVHNVPMSLVAPPAMDRVLQVIAKVLPQAGYQRTLFVGSPCAEEGTIGLIPGTDLKEILEPLARAVISKARELGAPMVVFKDVPSPYRPAMEKLNNALKFFHIHSYPGTEMNLAGSNIEGYFTSLARSHRHNFRKKLRKSKEILDLETTCIKRPDDAQLQEIFGLFMQTYERGKTKFEKLTIEFFRKIRETEPAWFILQRDKKNGSLVTFMLLFELGDRMVNKFIGLDYAKSGQTFLYFRQFEAALNFAYERGMKDFQSGQTGYRAKLDLGHSLVPLHNYCRHANPLINVVYSKFARDVTWLTLDPDLGTYLAAHKEKLEEAEKVSATGA